MTRMSQEFKPGWALILAIGMMVTGGLPWIFAQDQTAPPFTPPSGFQPLQSNSPAQAASAYAQAPGADGSPTQAPANPYSNPLTPPLGLPNNQPWGQAAPATRIPAAPEVNQSGTGSLALQSPSGGPAGPRPHSGSGASILPYDPLIDNHLIAPPVPIGMFGRPVGEVEDLLRGYGAKPSSYAFGKYSRYILSIYDLTLHFDRFRRLAGVDITPRPPFDRVEIEAQRFFLQFFFQGKDLVNFRASIQNRELQLRYSPPSAPQAPAEK